MTPITPSIPFARVGNYSINVSNVTWCHFVEGRSATTIAPSDPNYHPTMNVAGTPTTLVIHFAGGEKLRLQDEQAIEAKRILDQLPSF